MTEHSMLMKEEAKKKRQDEAYQCILGTHENLKRFFFFQPSTVYKFRYKFNSLFTQLPQYLHS